MDIFEDKSVLELLNSDSLPQFSTANLNRISDALAKVSLASSFDYGVLSKVFNCLRSWSSLHDVFTVWSHLASLYDTLLHQDYGQLEVLDSACELLFLVEDMIDQEKYKVTAGEHFLLRLVTLAGSKVTSVKLQRSAVEVISSLIVNCPVNQRILVEQLTPQWEKLVQQVLPKCGDFFVQASIVEISYRLSKRDVQLLDLLKDQRLKEEMRVLRQSKRRDFYEQTRIFLDHLNQSLGLSRSVFSFLAKDIVIDGQPTSLKEEKWVHFGHDHMSCYGVLSGSSSPQLVDVYYKTVTGLQICSDSSIEFYIGGLPRSVQTFLQDKSPSENFKMAFYFKEKDLSSVIEHILPKINCQKRNEKRDFNHLNSGNTSTTPSISSKSERSFRKASVGFFIPLPKRFKLPVLPRTLDSQTLINKASEDKIHRDTCKQQNQAKNNNSSQSASVPSDHMWESAFEAREEKSFVFEGSALPGTGKSLTYQDQVQGNCINDMAATTVMFAKEDTILECESGRSKINTEQKDLHPCSEKCGVIELLPPIKGAKAESISAFSKRNGEQQSHPISEGTAQKRAVNNKNGISSALLKAAKTSLTAEHRSTAVGQAPKRLTKKGNTLCNHNGEKENAISDSVDAPDVCNIQNDALPDLWMPKTTKTQRGKHKAESTERNEILRDKILAILKDANLPKSDSETGKKHSTSDPIETSSEGNSIQKTLCAASIEGQRKLRNQRAKRVERKANLTEEKEEKLACVKTVPHDVMLLNSNQPPVAAEVRTAQKRKSEYLQSKIEQTDCIHASVSPTTQGAMKQTFDKSCLYERKNLSRRQRRLLNFARGDPILPPLIGVDELLHSDSEKGLISPFDHTVPSKSRKSINIMNENIGKRTRATHSSSEESQGDQASARSSEEACELTSFKCTPRISTRDKELSEQNYKRVKNLHTRGIFSAEADDTINDNDGKVVSISREMQLLATLIEQFAQKIKLEARRKSEHILACTSEGIQRRCREVEVDIQADVVECITLGKEKFGLLKSLLQAEREKFEDTVQQWKDNFQTHVQRLKDISSQVDITHNHLKSVSDKLKLAHRKLLANLNELFEQQLTEADQKLLAIRKAARGLRAELKGALVAVLF